MNIHYRICINNKQDEEGRNISMCDGYKPGDPLTVAWSGTEDFPTAIMSNPTREEINPKDVCEVLYERFNIDHPEGYKNRSLSVGDLVTLQYDNKTLAFAVDRVGFIQVECPKFVAIIGDSGMSAAMAAAILRMRGSGNRNV